MKSGNSNSGKKSMIRGWMSGAESHTRPRPVENSSRHEQQPPTTSPPILVGSPLASSSLENSQLIVGILLDFWILLVYIYFWQTPTRTSSQKAEAMDKSESKQSLEQRRKSISKVFSIFDGTNEMGRLVSMYMTLFRNYKVQLLFIAPCLTSRRM
jgi:hypothetical protein